MKARIVGFLKSLFHQQDEIFCDLCNEMQPQHGAEHFGDCWICYGCLSDLRHLGEQVVERYEQQHGKNSHTEMIH